ncbi:MAG: YkvA family protein [Woeseiaceae bacterium]|nr:YkvA family protein [Woeseiaceae bacterium]
MQIEKIWAQIEDGKLIEQRTGSLRRAVVDLAKLYNVSTAQPEVERTVGFVIEYIEHAPALMTQIDEEAARNGVQADVQPILNATEDYFLAPDDIIPDRYGLVGLLDDAYLTHSLMEAVSDRCKLQSGKSLLPAEAHAINTFIKRLIGVPFITTLDEYVVASMEQLGVEPEINQLLAALAKIDLLSLQDPLWRRVGATMPGWNSA